MSPPPRRGGAKPLRPAGKTAHGKPGTKHAASKGDARTRSKTQHREHQQPARSSPLARARSAQAQTWTAGPNALVVGGFDASLDLAHYLHETLRGGARLSLRQIRRVISSGACRVNGRVETFHHRELRKGDIVEFDSRAEDPLDHDFAPSRLIYDADELIAYDKPAGLPVTPTEGRRTWCLEKLLKKALGPVEAVHRLDAETSGLVLFARHPAMATWLKDCFRDHAIAKTYRAIVRGHPLDEGRKRSYLVCVDKQPGFERWGTGRGPGAREAVTTWKVDERLGRNASLLTVRPLTGRYHQIRIHCAEMGHPLLGDRIYGDRQDPIAVSRHLLHAEAIDLPLPPRAGQSPRRLVLCTKQLPDDFQNAIAALRDA